MENIILTLSCLPKVGKKTILYFIENMMNKPKDERDLLDIFIDIKSNNKRIIVPTLDQLKEAITKSEEIILSSQKQNIKNIDILNENFPKKLINIENPPVILFYKGNYNSLINDNSVAIVGSRRAGLKALEASYKLGNIFGKEKYSIVSGLAIGCDEQAHKGCLDVKGNTVAVLPCGLDDIYPSSNKDLANNILENNGCLVSEYPIEMKSFKNNFIERDRIQSGLSSAVIVCESDVNSGTMHTIDFSKRQNRILACLDIEASGNQKLIKEEKCIVIRNKEDIKKLKLEIDKFNDYFYLNNFKQSSKQLKIEL
ncbi:DNA-processing protein DprA [Romboutsia sp.]|uniref:DNA-processing protein DprA n=1 Tax=Romboutsia sp. TaxID=1965302 RepID=UPI002BCF75F7|nr:DNA-processing protein DprA [Romboutsia sp.]HSQ89549.1 DNA-processing protein DprA [Romboutsia sp.]